MKAAMVGRGLAWAFALAVLALLLVLTGSVWLAGLLVVVVLLPFFSLFWNTAAGKTLEARVSFPTGGRKGVPAEGRVSVIFPKLQPLGKVYCTIRLVNDLTGEETLLDVPLERGSGKAAGTIPAMDIAGHGVASVEGGTAGYGTRAAKGGGKHMAMSAGDDDGRMPGIAGNGEGRVAGSAGDDDGRMPGIAGNGGIRGAGIPSGNPGLYGAALTVRTEHCGRIRVLVEMVVLAGMFGFPAKHVHTHGEGHVTVLPETFPVGLDALLLSAPKDGDDARDDKKGTDMTETFQLREYVPGDNLHGIHWKLSGKLDRLIYREPDQPVSNSLLLYWDQSSGTPDELDALAEAVFSVGQSLCQAGVPFTVGKTEQGVLQTAEVANIDGLVEYFPMLLRRVGEQRTGIQELADFGKVFYFTAALPDAGGYGAEAYDSVQVFLCGGEAGVTGSEIVFTPETAEEAFRQL